MKLDLKFWKYRNKHDIFESISGNDDIKWAFKRALEAPEPVHILLVGPPGIGKTRFLEAMEKAYENSYMALGSGSTGAGMVKTCFEK
jgi:DNA replicative helicase MCM subunit Mcm2 (Cdc46/Mcm family)